MAGDFVGPDGAPDCDPRLGGQWTLPTETRTQPEAPDPEAQRSSTMRSMRRSGSAAPHSS